MSTGVPQTQVQESAIKRQRSVMCVRAETADHADCRECGEEREEPARRPAREGLRIEVVAGVRRQAAAIQLITPQPSAPLRLTIGPKGQLPTRNDPQTDPTV